MSYPNSDPFAQNPYTQNPYRAVGGQTFVGGPSNAILGMQRPFSYPNNNPRSVPGSSPVGNMGPPPNTGMNAGIPSTPYGSPQGFNPMTNNFSAHYATSGGLAAQAAQGGGGGGGGGGMSWNTTPKDLEVQAERSAQRIGNKDGEWHDPSPTSNWLQKQQDNSHFGEIPAAMLAKNQDPKDPSHSWNQPQFPDPGTPIPGLAYGGATTHRAIVGDPQADGGPNPELVETYGPIRVTPLRNLPQRQAHASWARLPHYADGTDDGTSGNVTDDPIDDADDDNSMADSGMPAAPPVFNNQPVPAADQAAPPWGSPSWTGEDSSVAPDDENPPDTSMDDDSESSTEPDSGQAQSPSQGAPQTPTHTPWEVSKTNTPTIALYNEAAHGGDHFREAADYYTGTPHSAEINIGPILDSKGHPQLDAKSQPQYAYTWNTIRDAIQKTGASRIMILDHTAYYTPTGTRRLAIGQAFSGNPLTPDSVAWKNLVSAMPANRKMTVVLCGCDSGDNGGGAPSREYLNGLVDAASKLGKSVEIVGYGQTMIHGVHGVSASPYTNDPARHAPTQTEREIGTEFRAPQDTTGPR